MGKGRDKRRRKKKKIEKKAKKPEVFVRKSRPLKEKTESTVPVFIPAPTFEGEAGL
jgi:hypothetical protein